MDVTAIGLNRGGLFFRYIMRRVNLFLILFVTSIIALIVLNVVGFYVLSSGSSEWVNDMWSHMGGMMGGSSDVIVQNPASPYFMVGVVVLVGVVIVSAGGLVYFFMSPEVKTGQARRDGQVSAQDATAYEAIVKTLTNEERKVIEVLNIHEGKYLQKYIRKEAGLSRLKTHRILVRLADRGIVTLKKIGNTNEVRLADLLRK
jgi:hypothetical protein